MGRAANARDKLIMNIEWRILVKNDSEACWAVNIKKSDFVRTAVPEVGVRGRSAVDAGEPTNNVRSALPWTGLIWSWAPSEDGSQALFF